MDIGKDSYERIIDSLHSGLYFVNRDRVITYWNKAAQNISGFSAEEVVGRSCSDNILTHIDSDGNSLCLSMCPLAATISDGTPREAEIFLHHKDGHRVPVSVRVSTLTDEQGKVIGGIELFTDISSQRTQDLRIKELEKLALLDGLTQLANRSYIEQELRNRLEELRRFHVPFGVLFMDVDHFKRVNDTHGHVAGDAVLRFIARTFIANARPFDLYGRWGGEEFIGIIRNVTSEELAQVGERLRLLIEHSYVMQGAERIQVTISVGATTVREADTIDALVKRTDALLYQSKSAGRNRLTLS
jgi:diguanylate cyclase (GGDEF)-like protein/PAS domain S-box-containing protein